MKKSRLKKNSLKYKWVWVLIAVAMIFYFIGSYLIVGVKVEPMKGSLSERNLFFEVDKKNVTFGDVPLGYQMDRRTDVNNEFDFPVKVYLYSSGEMSKFVKILPNRLYLNPGETKKINIYFQHNTLNERLGKYEGKLIVVTRRQILGV